jgi:lipopolysaccharide/colanic/teichoic acid biosynthesis glycosyltransferase
VVREPSGGSIAASQPQPTSEAALLPRNWYVVWGKRTFDVCVAGVVMVVFLPLFALVALGVLIAMGRPVVYRQERVGRNGHSFTMLKFRSMHHDRRATEGGYRGQDRRQDHKSDHDPRHNAFGRFIRKTSLDEMPQLWNVLRGDMSLVGPRPELRTVAERHDLIDHVRHTVRPGITGQWQVSGDRPGYVHQNVAHDERYVQELTLRRDLSIILRTPRALTKGK